MSRAKWPSSRYSSGVPFEPGIARRFAEIESDGITRSITAPRSLLE